MVQKEKKNQLLKGPSLAAFARKKALSLGLDGKGKKLADLVWMIQTQEGHTAYFKNKKTCSHLDCCWQLSCGAKMD